MSSAKDRFVPENIHFPIRLGDSPNSFHFAAPRAEVARLILHAHPKASIAARGFCPRREARTPLKRYSERALWRMARCKSLSRAFANRLAVARAPVSKS